MTMSFIKQILRDDSYTVQLITSINTEDQIFYAYLLIKAKDMPTLENVLKSQNIDLRKYGVVLASGFGHQPPDDVRNYISSRSWIAEAKTNLA